MGIISSMLKAFWKDTEDTYKALLLCVTMDETLNLKIHILPTHSHVPFTILCALLQQAASLPSGHEAVPHVVQNHFSILMTGSDPFSAALGA